MSKGFWSLPVLLLVAASCASKSSSTTTSAEAAAAIAAEPRPATPRANRNVITLEELSPPAIRAMNVLDVIRSLRPTFLTDRGKSSQSNPEAGRVHASIDYNGVIPLNDLRSIPSVGVIEIRYLEPAAAMNRFGGAAHQGPVIVVRTH
jgi:hypothetical protein